MAASAAACARRHAALTGPPRQWELIDDNNSRKGVILTYAGGDKCGSAKQRKVSYHFMCTHEDASWEEGPMDFVEAPVF